MSALESFPAFRVDPVSKSPLPPSHESQLGRWMSGKWMLVHCQSGQVIAWFGENQEHLARRAADLLSAQERAP